MYELLCTNHPNWLRHSICYSMLKNLHNNQVGVHFFSYYNGHATATLNSADYFTNAHCTVHWGILHTSLTFFAMFFCLLKILNNIKKGGCVCSHKMYFFCNYYVYKFLNATGRWLCFVKVSPRCKALFPIHKESDLTTGAMIFGEKALCLTITLSKVTFR